MRSLEKKEPNVSQRIISIDFFRGISVFLMFVYNYIPFFVEKVPSVFQHNRLNQFTFGDLVAPFFLFIMGVTLAVSVAGRLAQGQSREIVIRRIIKRTVLLVGIGLLLDLSLGVIVRNPLHYTWGVLETLGTSYLISFLLWGYGTIMRIVIVASMLLAHLILSRFPWYSNVVMLIAHGGPLSVLSYAPITVFGLICGERLVKSRDNYELFLLRVALSLVGAALLLSFLSPINKRLVTSSYSLLSSGLSAAFFLVIYYFMETRKVSVLKRALVPFRELGTNALFAWVLQYVIAAPFIYYFYNHEKLQTFCGIVLSGVLIATTWITVYLANRRGIRLRM